MSNPGYHGHLFDSCVPSLFWSATDSRSFPVSHDPDILEESWPGIWWWFSLAQPQSFPLQELKRWCRHSSPASGIFIDQWVEMDPWQSNFVLLKIHFVLIPYNIKLQFSLRTSIIEILIGKEYVVFICYPFTMKMWSQQSLFHYKIDSQNSRKSVWTGQPLHWYIFIGSRGIDESLKFCTMILFFQKGQTALSKMNRFHSPY